MVREERSGRRRFPWEWLIVLLLLGVAIVLIVSAFLPPAPPPYIG
ncbi:MAG: hypothetical protein QXP57_07165 [Nitrososphaerota archaeon]